MSAQEKRDSSTGPVGVIGLGNMGSAMAANLVGLAACCIGVLFTGPLVMVWQTAAILYLYRSWTGRPLTQGA